MKANQITFFEGLLEQYNHNYLLETCGMKKMKMLRLLPISTVLHTAVLQCVELLLLVNNLEPRLAITTSRPLLKPYNNGVRKRVTLEQPLTVKM